MPIELDKENASILLPDKVGKIKIISGGGDYSLVFPKVITAYDHNGVSGALSVIEIPYSEYLDDIISAHINESNNIVIEWESRFDLHFEGVFMVKNSEGAKRLLEILCHPVGVYGLRPPTDVAYGHLLNDKSYWVNY